MATKFMHTTLLIIKVKNVNHSVAGNDKRVRKTILNQISLRVETYEWIRHTILVWKGVIKHKPATFELVNLVPVCSIPP